MFKFDECNLANYLGNSISYSHYINLPIESPTLNLDFFRAYNLMEYKDVLITLIREEVLSKGISILTYGGTQYGSYRDLGDGRSGYIGRLIYNQESFDISIKGISSTQYSKGNGLATYKECVWELKQGNYLSSKCIPSTQVIAYWKHKDNTHCTYIRITKSLVRIGTLEYLSRLKDSQVLLDKCCDYYMTHVIPGICNSKEDLYKYVINTYVNTCNIWESINFTHGRLNSDNVLLCGWVHDSIKSNELSSMYSYHNQRYAIGMSLEYLGITLGLSSEIYLDLISSITN